jgi:hypothetical protein
MVEWLRHAGRESLVGIEKAPGFSVAAGYQNPARMLLRMSRSDSPFVQTTAHTALLPIDTAKVSPVTVIANERFGAALMTFASGRLAKRGPRAGVTRGSQLGRARGLRRAQSSWRPDRLCTLG